MVAALQSPVQTAPPRPPLSLVSPQAQTVSDEFIQWAKQRSKDFDSAADPSRLLRYRKWSKVDFYVRGRQLLYWDEGANAYLDLPASDTELHHVTNYFWSVIDTLATEYSKSKPNFVAYSRAGDDQRVQEAVDNAQYLIDTWRTSLWTLRLLQREAHLVLIRGGVFTRTYVDKSAGPPVEVPEFETAVKTVAPGQYGCPHCGVQGSLSWESQPGDDAFPPPPNSCPQCGNGPIDIQNQAVLARTIALTGSRKVPSGELRSDPIDPYEVDIADRATGPWDSPYLRWDSVQFNSKLAEEFPNWDQEKAKSSATGVNADKLIGLQYARQLELEIGNLGTADQSNSAWISGRFGSNAATLTDKLTSVRSQIHYRVGDYRNKTFPADIYVPGCNKVVPAGMKLGDAFPHGLRIILINGECIDVQDACLDDEWHGYTVTVPSRGFYGNGAEQFVAIQDWINDSVSLAITMAMMTAAGILVMDKDRYEGATGRPGDVLTMLDRGIGEKVSDGIEHISISGDHGQVQNLLSMSKADLVNVSGARSPDWGGEPSQTPGKQLATGINYNNAIASAVAGMKLELRAENQCRRFEQALKLFPQVSVYPRYMRTQDDVKGRWMRGYDIGHDIAVRFEEDSAQPLTSLERRANLVAAINQLGYGKVDPNGKPVNAPWIEREIAKRFSLASDPDASDAWQTIAYRRIDAMMEAAGMAQRFAMALPPAQAKQFISMQILRAGLEREEYELTDPLAITPNKGDKHMSLVEAYANYCATDEYRKAPLPVKEAIEALLPLHFAAEQKDEADKAMITKQAMAPLNPPPEPPPPPKESISLKDALAVPGAAEQMLAQAGIHVAPRPVDVNEDKQSQPDDGAQSGPAAQPDDGGAMSQSPIPPQVTQQPPLSPQV